MNFKTANILVLVVSLFSTLTVFSQPQFSDHPGAINDDQQIIHAVTSQRSQYYVEGGNLTVTKMLEEDHSGLPHQKWMAELSSGQQVMIVYNLDMGNRVPLKEGDKFSVGGQFIWTKNGGLVHWTHDDPRQTRPDGYVYFNGVVYGDSDNEDAGRNRH